MTIQPKHRGALALFALLALSMLVTRYHHFGSALHLADTSWAVFFLAGLLLPQRWALAALLLLAAGIDVAALQLDGNLVGGCLTAAYPGLLLSYAALWGIGRLARQQNAHGFGNVHGLIAAAGWLVLGVMTAFAISNLTYWAWAGPYDSMPLAEYTARVMPYLAGYMTTAATYTLLALVIGFTWHQLRRGHEQGHDDHHVADRT